MFEMIARKRTCAATACALIGALLFGCSDSSLSSDTQGRGKATATSAEEEPDENELMLNDDFDLQESAEPAHQGKVRVEFTGENGGQLIAPENCSQQFGSGGNYVERSTVLKGKCQGNFVAPSLRSEGSRKFLRFATKKSRVASPKDRAEVAWPVVLQFNDDVEISFRLRIPETSEVTDQSFYVLQLWQCPGLPPIAGVRIKRGTSHTVQFITRGTVLREAGRPATRVTSDLTPGKWKNFVLRARVNPNENGNGYFSVSSDGTMLREWSGPYGFKGEGVCAGGFPTPKTYRVKFGLYKGTEKERSHQIDYDLLRISN